MPPMTRTAVQPDSPRDVPPAESLVPMIEALLLTADRPMGLSRLAQMLGLEEGSASAKGLREAIDAFNRVCDEQGRAYRVEQVAGGYRLMVRAEYAPLLAQAHGAKEAQSLSRAAVETLAVVAYRQPITRADLEAIRGVGCGEVLRTLLEKRLIDIAGRADEPGRPMLYGTTKRFLETFGLASIKDLPTPGDFAPVSQSMPPNPPGDGVGAAPQEENAKP